MVAEHPPCGAVRRISEIRGQPVAKRLLETFLTGRIPPLMLFVGPPGTGRWPRPLI